MRLQAPGVCPAACANAIARGIVPDGRPLASPHQDVGDHVGVTGLFAELQRAVGPQVAPVGIARVVVEEACELRPVGLDAEQLLVEFAPRTSPMVGDQLDLAPYGRQHVVGAEHGVVMIEDAQQPHPVRHELRIDVARCRCCRGAKTECGPDARAEEAPTAQGVHVFSRLLLKGRG
jgi:hypothetical protein